MAFYWWWEDVSPVRRLRDQYDELLDDLDSQIKRVENRINTRMRQINTIHKKLKTYNDASGCMADLYYQKLEKSETLYRNIISNSQGYLDQMRNKRRIAQQTRNTLQYYYRKEQREEREYSLREIGL